MRRGKEYQERGGGIRSNSMIYTPGVDKEEVKDGVKEDNGQKKEKDSKQGRRHGYPNRIDNSNNRKG